MSIIRKIYLYLFSAIGLVVVIIGAVQLVDLGLKTFVFQKADVYLEYPRPVPQVLETTIEGKPVLPIEIPAEELKEFNEAQRQSDRQRSMANSLAMIIVGLPLYLYHWQILKSEMDSTKKELKQS